MTEDLDNDLGELGGDLDDLDLGDLPAAEGASAEADEGVGSDSIELDDDLQSMLGDSDDVTADGTADATGGGDEPSAGSDEMDLGDFSLGGDEPSAGSDAPAPAPAPPAAPAPRLPSLGMSGGNAVNLEFLLDIKLHVTFEVGRSKMMISDLLTLGQGSVIELHRLVGDELDLLINGKLIAKGEVVVVNEKFGCKITDVISPEDRVKHLGSI